MVTSGTSGELVAPAGGAEDRRSIASTLGPRQSHRISAVPDAHAATRAAPSSVSRSIRSSAVRVELEVLVVDFLVLAVGADGAIPLLSMSRRSVSSLRTPMPAPTPWISGTVLRTPTSSQHSAPASLQPILEHHDVVIDRVEPAADQVELVLVGLG